MKASDHIAEVLAAQGVTHVFELVGGMITHLIDSISMLRKSQLVSMHHEQAAAFAADAYGRMAGVPGVAMATSGPGATNLLTGIGSAHFDSSPSVVDLIPGVLFISPFVLQLVEDNAVVQDNQDVAIANRIAHLSSPVWPRLTAGEKHVLILVHESEHLGDQRAHRHERIVRRAARRVSGTPRRRHPTGGGVARRGGRTPRSWRPRRS